MNKIILAARAALVLALVGGAVAVAHAESGGGALAAKTAALAHHGEDCAFNTRTFFGLRGFTLCEDAHHDAWQRHHRLVRGPRGPRGFRGATGATGPAGPAGPAGADGAPGLGNGTIMACVSAGGTLQLDVHGAPCDNAGHQPVQLVVVTP